MKKTTLAQLFCALLATGAIAAPEEMATPTTETPTTVATKTVVTAPTIDCNYHIPTSQKTIDTATITTWAENATLQAFSFSHATIQAQLKTLKHCFTDQGWKGFSDALQKSGNIDSIQTQHLTVSSQTDGPLLVNAVKDNQWKAVLPIQVVYQNDKEKITQRLKVDLLIGRKPSGDLGFMQMIAVTQPPTAIEPQKNDQEKTAPEAQKPPAPPAPPAPAK